MWSPILDSKGSTPNAVSAQHRRPCGRHAVEGKRRPLFQERRGKMRLLPIAGGPVKGRNRHLRGTVPFFAVSILDACRNQSQVFFRV